MHSFERRHDGASRGPGRTVVAAASALLSAAVVLTLQKAIVVSSPQRSNPSVSLCGQPTAPLAAEVAIPAGFVADYKKMRSQNNQDKWLYETFFKVSPLIGTGFFIEFGARDGVEHSNSYFFEHALAWSGVLLEVLPAEQGRIAVNRPRSAVIDGGICEYDGPVEILNHSVKGFGGRADMYDTQRMSDALKSPSIQAACFRLETVLRVFGVKHVNYLSVDVEGAELQALLSFPWRDVMVDVVGVEVLLGTVERLAKEREIIAFMQTVGYKVARHFRFAEDTKDMFFTRLHPSLKLPVETHDRVRFAEAKEICRSLQRCL